MGQFDCDFEEHAYDDRLREAFMNGACNGVSGTPKLFINNERCGTAEEPTTPLEKPSLTPQ